VLIQIPFSRVEVLTTVDEARLRDLRARDEFFWIDLLAPSDEVLNTLGAILELHPVALEDTREFRQRPKIDAYEHHVLLVFFTARATGDEAWPAVPVEVHVYVSGGFVATVRREQCLLLDELHRTLVPEGTAEEEFIVYKILDALTDAYYPVIDALENEIDDLEAQVLDKPRREHLSRIYRLKQDVHNLHRIVSAQKEQYQRGSDSILGLSDLSKGSRAYLRDVGDHLVQVASELHRQTEDLMSLTGTYFNANSDRLNAVATRLAVGGTLFVVWTLVTGFFGQNFPWLIGHIAGFHRFLIFGVGGFVVPTVILLTLFWVKRDDWF
jgi:magnesium transporter